MTNIKYETKTVTAIPARFVKLSNEQLPIISSQLAARLRRKELTAEELAAAYYPRPVGELGMFEAARFETIEGTFVPNGNDVLLVDGTLIEFAPLVKVKTSLDMSYLVNADGDIVENSPMIDNHWMDEQAEREYSEMLDFANYVNA